MCFRSRFFIVASSEFKLVYDFFLRVILWQAVVLFLRFSLGAGDTNQLLFRIDLDQPHSLSASMKQRNFRDLRRMIFPASLISMMSSSPVT